MVEARPTALFTKPTSSSENPAPRKRNAVVSEPANASPSLYSTSSTRIQPALGREKNSRKGSTTASRKVLGAAGAVEGSSPQNAAKTPTAIRAAMSR